MSITEILFIGFSLFTILCSVGVVFCRNAVYSALSLVMCLFGLSTLYVLWDATFMATIQILIYAGAIVVLFVFVVMILDIGRGAGSHWHGWFTAVIAGFGAWLFGLYVLRSLNSSDAEPVIALSTSTGLREISSLLFTDYLWPFEVLSLFLLTLIIAIYAVARPQTADEAAQER